MPKIITDKKKIDKLLTRGVEEVIDKKHLRARMLSGKRLRVKLGIDPTSSSLHLGRSIPLLKLRDFQELGHQVVFIVGDFTAVIGDTSDKESERPMLTPQDVQKNLKSYKEQVAKIVDISACEFRHNSEWLTGLNYHQIGEQADQFSLAEFLARENIKKRLDAGKRVSLRELLYPLMQGYDSVAVKADVELGGTDQRFNLLSGRTLQRFFKQEAQDIIMNPLVEGLDGRKMSSSWGNTINLTDNPDTMYGKVMSMGDELMIKYFTFCTRVPLTDIKNVEARLKKKENPRDIKMQLARVIVEMYHNKKSASAAEEQFVKIFQKKDAPNEMPEVKPSAYDIVVLLVEAGICKSKGEARRVIDQGGVKINDKKVAAQNYSAMVKKGDIVQKGSRWFVKVK
ncbi:MAG: Tyrosine-tRNA ligase [Candidatus Magasanikbacteria bacterium GW2011_GWC2_45_8]|uniref:Tyrosine--tRNA ligase n=1 Tax=Candidatus Magasanikbacteria bacterium GW2011_GWC2_45_8 TaxID=1619050 RepID=A0A0G1MXU5_9BACT|nr:MAG: Tyrosine-tRNA ligase [Candidatus Magasanikbacteria bacterium GW2011_GWC2_45_8]